jgi:hypothetical protein
MTVLVDDADQPISKLTGSTRRFGATSNFVAAFQMVNEGLAKRIASGKKKRQEWTTDEFDSAMRLMPEVLNALVREIKSNGSRCPDH